MKQKKKTPLKSTRSAPTKKEQVPVDLFSTIEKSINKNQKYTFYVIFLFAILFGLLLFDVKISEGNDDSLYIEGGYNYATNFTDYYFTANAPMYPMLLGLFTALFGMNLILFKVLSFIFFISHLYFFYLAFRNRIPALVLYPVLLFTGINSYFLYYASQTYTESLFLLLQALVFYSFIKVEENESSENKKLWKSWLMLGLLYIMLSHKNGRAFYIFLVHFLFLKYLLKFLSF
jgi:hypothetical protein